MTIEHIIQNLRREIIRTFAVADEWFDKEEPLHQYKPCGGGWSVAEILEHLTLTNHYLLIIIEKGQEKALRRMRDGRSMNDELKNYTLAIPGLLEIGEHRSFEWTRPEHHHPRGDKNIQELRFLMRDQLCRCLYVLECMPHGEGALHRTTMSVNGLGKLDMYQYLYFLSLHLKRHLIQMSNVENEFIGAGITEQAPC